MKKGQLPTVRIDEDREKDCRDAAENRGQTLSDYIRETMERQSAKDLKYPRVKASKTKHRFNLSAHG